MDRDREPVCILDLLMVVLRLFVGLQLIGVVLFLDLNGFYGEELRERDKTGFWLHRNIEVHGLTKLVPHFLQVLFLLLPIKLY